MNEKERTRWEKAQEQGIRLHILQYMLGIAAGFALMDGVVNPVYVLVKQGNWSGAAYVEQIQRINWISLLLRGAIIGFFVGLFNWYGTEKKYNQPNA